MLGVGQVQVLGDRFPDPYWRSLRASLIAADDLLTLAVARARGRLNVGVHVTTWSLVNGGPLTPHPVDHLDGRHGVFSLE